MKHYNNFKKQAQISYHVAIVCSDDFERALQSSTYLIAFLNGYIDALIETQVCTIEEIKMCRQYAEIVRKAFSKYHVRTKY